MSDTRVIKRYANRKLYDTHHSRYVTLEQISEMIRDGDDVKIIDNKSKEDLTSVTLAQIIFEEEKKQRSFLSLQTMRNLIQNGGESLSSLVTVAQRRVTSILPRRKEDEAMPGEETTSPDHTAEMAEAEASPDETDEADETTAMGKRGREGLGSLREFREWLQQTQHTIDEWQKRVDHRIRDMVEGISPLSGIHKDVKGLATRIAELEAKLAGLHAGVEATDASASSADQEVSAAPTPTADGEGSAEQSAEPTATASPAATESSSEQAPSGSD